MGIMNEVLKADAPAFVDPDMGFGEAVTYRRYSTSLNYSFNATVIRHTPEERSTNDTIPFMDVYLVNDSTWVKGPGSLDTGADTITVAYRYGGTAEAHSFTVPEDQDAGMWHVQIK